jgi:hypothetical protein
MQAIADPKPYTVREGSHRKAQVYSKSMIINFLADTGYELQSRVVLLSPST